MLTFRNYPTTTTSIPSNLPSCCHIPHPSEILLTPVLLPSHPFPLTSHLLSHFTSHLFPLTSHLSPLTTFLLSPFTLDDLAIAEQVLRERGIVEEKNGRDDGTACSSERYRQSLEGARPPPSTPRPFRGL